MAQDDFLDWLNEDGGDRYVQRKLEAELQDAYAYQARESSAIRSQMAQLTGSLEQRLDRLTKAFYAFVELSDLRAEMAVFEAEASVRHAALRLLRSLLRRAADPGAELQVPPLPADLPRCRGYWLRPAVGSVAALLAGDEGAAAAALAEAQELDAVRTAVLRTTSLAVAGQAALAFPLLPAALQQPGEQVTYAQRALWRACAHGVYGEAGAGLIGEWLAGHVDGLDAEAAAAEGSQWASAAAQAFKVAELPGHLRRGLSHALSQRDELISPLVAARELSALASWVREAVTGEPADPAAAAAATSGTGPGAGTARRGATGKGAKGKDGAGPGAADADGAEHAVDFPVTALGAVAAALTEEGSRDEITLARRARELREIIDDKKAATRPSWDAPQDATLSLLRADAFGPDLRLRKLALDAGARWITALADGLVKSATVSPPDQLEISVDGHAVQLTAAGQASLAAAYAEIEQENAPQTISDKLFGKKQAAEETAREQGWLASGANHAAATFAARVAELRAAAQQAPADHEAITAALSSD
jgi:hypothetical protein